MIDSQMAPNKVLEYCHIIGLWEGTEIFDDKGNSTGYVIKRVKLNDVQFKRAKELLDKLDNYGMNEKQKKKYQDKQKKQSKDSEELHKKALEHGIN